MKNFEYTEILWQPKVDEIVKAKTIEWEYSKVGELYCWNILHIKDYDLVRKLINKFNKENTL